MNGFDLSTISGVYVGSTQYNKIYYGSTLIWQNIPYDSEVEYLQSDGNQYIDTGVIPDGDTGIYIKVDKSTTQNSRIVGCRNDSGDTRWVIGRNSNWYCGYGANYNNSYTLAFSTNNTAELMLNFLNNGYWRGYGDSGNGREYLLPTLSFTPTYNIRLFGSIEPTNSKFSGKLYAVKISQGSNIIMDLIPVRKDGIGYMYDKISKQLFGNDGTGNFTYGSDITSTPALYDAKIEYLETSGSAYINTELTTLQYPIKLDTEIYLTATGNERAISGNSYPGSSGDQVFTFGVYNSKFFIWGGSTSWQLGSETAAANTWHNVQFELPAVDSRKLTVSGTEYSTTTFNSTPGNGYITDNTHPVYLMYEGNNTSKIPNKGRIKYAKYYIGGQLVRDFIPVRVGTVGCLYDKVSQKLFKNVYTGVFTLGPDIVENDIYDAELEYLESDGNSFIDTGITPDSNIGISIKANRGSTVNNHLDTYVVGLRNDSNDTRWCIGNNNDGWYYGYNVYAFTTFQVIGDIAECKLNYLNDGKFEVKTINDTQNITLPALNFTPSYNIRLFGAAGVSADYMTYKGRIYYVKITNGTTIIKDLIPVRKNNIGYMYDKISGRLYSNNGTGSFILGPDVS